MHRPVIMPVRSASLCDLRHFHDTAFVGPSSCVILRELISDDSAEVLQPDVSQLLVGWRVLFSSWSSKEVEPYMVTRPMSAERKS